MVNINKKINNFMDTLIESIKILDSNDTVVSYHKGVMVI